MAKGNLQFDFNQAEALRKQLTSNCGEIDSTLNEIKKDVDGVTAWWSGGSEKAFIENFGKTQVEIKKGLQEWLNEYDKLLGKVQDVKRETDRNLASAINK